MEKINIELRKIQSGFIVENSFLDGEEKYFTSFNAAKNYVDVCLNHFEDEVLKENK